MDSIRLIKIAYENIIFNLFINLLFKKKNRIPTKN